MFESIRKLKRYERRFFVLMTISSITNSFPILTFLVTQYKPSFECQQNNITSQSIKETTLQNSTTRGNNFTSFQLEIQSCQISVQYFNQSNSSANWELPCESWEYDLIPNENSALTEFNLVCGDEWVNDMAISLFMWAITIGGVCGGILSDRFGRKLIFLASTFVQFLLTFTLGFATDKISYLVLTFLNGGSNMINYGAAAVLGFETLPKHCHNSFYYGLILMYAVGNMIVPGIAFYLRDWRWFVRTMGLLGLFYIPYLWLIDESPSWLFASKKTEDLEKLMNKIDKYNGDEITSTKLMVKEDDKAHKYVNVWETWKILFKHRNLIGRLLVIVYSWSMTSLLYYAITLNTNNLIGNRFLNCFVSACTEVVALTICYFICEQIEHRLIFIWSIGAGGIAVAITPFVTEVSGIGATVLTMTAKFCASISFYILYVYVPVLFPTTMRSSSTGLSTSTSRLVGILTPLIMRGASNKMTSVIFGGLLILSALLNIPLPNTRNKKLPVTIEEAIKLKTIKNLTDDETKYSSNQLQT